MGSFEDARNRLIEWGRWHHNCANHTLPAGTRLYRRGKLRCKVCGRRYPAATVQVMNDLLTVHYTPIIVHCLNQTRRGPLADDDYIVKAVPESEPSVPSGTLEHVALIAESVPSDQP